MRPKVVFSLCYFHFSLVGSAHAKPVLCDRAYNYVGVHGNTKGLREIGRQQNILILDVSHIISIYILQLISSNRRPRANNNNTIQIRGASLNGEAIFRSSVGRREPSRTVVGVS